jgi:hypothetical protein
MEALGGRGGIAPTHSRPRHLMGGEWSASRPGRALPPGKGPSVPTVQEAGWAPEPVWTQRLEGKSFAPAGDRTPIARSSRDHSSLMMEAVRTSETSVDNYFTRQYIPEDNSEHHTRRHENLKSHVVHLVLSVYFLSELRTLCSSD